MPLHEGVTHVLKGGFLSHLLKKSQPASTVAPIVVSSPSPVAQLPPPIASQPEPRPKVAAPPPPTCHPAPPPPAVIKPHSQPPELPPPPAKRRQLDFSGREAWTQVLSQDYVGPREYREQLKAFIAERTQHPVPLPRTKFIFLLEGPHGCGKLTLVNHVARELGRRVEVMGPLDLASGEDQSIKKSRNGLTLALRIHRLLSTRDVCTGVAPILVFHGFDGWTANARTAALKVLRTITGKEDKPKKDAKKKTPKRSTASSSSFLTPHERTSLMLAQKVCCPLILTQSPEYYRDKKQLQPLAQTLVLQPPPFDKLSEWLTHLSLRLKISLSREHISRLIQTCRGDVRHMIQELSFWHDTASSHATAKDVRSMGYFDLIPYLFGSTTLKGSEEERLIRRQQATEHDMLIPAVHTNYPLACRRMADDRYRHTSHPTPDMNRAVQDLNLMASMAHDVSLSDLTYEDSWIPDMLVMSASRARAGPKARFPEPQFFSHVATIRYRLQLLRQSAETYAVSTLPNTWDLRQSINQEVVLPNGITTMLTPFLNPEWLAQHPQRYAEEDGFKMSFHFTFKSAQS